MNSRKLRFGAGKFSTSFSNCFNISGRHDSEDRLNHQIQKVDFACAELLKTTKETKFPFRISDYRVQFDVDLNIKKAVAALISTHMLGGGSLLTAAAMCAGVDCKSKIQGSFGRTGASQIKSNPYRYCIGYHERLFR
ncbi:MAG: hypothetical protein ABW189_08215 [Rickettsiales bacterium]